MQKITYTKVFPDGYQEIVNFPISQAIILGLHWKDENQNEYIIYQSDVSHLEKYKKKVLTKYPIELNGDMANQFNESQDYSY
jgi:hypothetical protein